MISLVINDFTVPFSFLSDIECIQLYPFFVSRFFKNRQGTISKGPGRLGNGPVFWCLFPESDTR